MIFYIIISSVVLVALVITTVVMSLNWRRMGDVKDRTISELKNEIISLTHQMEVDELRTQSLDDLNLRLDQLKSTYNSTSDQLNMITENVSKKVQILKEMEDQQTNLISTITKNKEILEDLIQRQMEIKKVNDGLVNEGEGLKSKIDELVKWHNRVVLEGANEINHELGLIQMTAASKSLHEILQRLSIEYPELAADFLKLEWGKIWLPKMQEMIKSHGWWDIKNGIYKLSLISDPKICYIGQAVDIKDRWYQHAKKMVGVDSKGNERLYNYTKDDGTYLTPADFSWELVERELDKSEMDEREHYWIEWYGCTEIGLNKKK